MDLKTPIVWLAALVASTPLVGQEEATDQAGKLISSLLKIARPQDDMKARLMEQQLLAMGPKAVPALVSALRRTKAKSQDRVLMYLGWIGRDATAALPFLYEMIGNSKSRSDALYEAFGAIIPWVPGEKDKAVDVLANSWMTRLTGKRVSSQTIAKARYRLDLDANSKTSALLDKLKTGNIWERELAAELLVHARGDRDVKVAALRKCLSKKPSKRGYERYRVSFRTANGSSSMSGSLRPKLAERMTIARSLVAVAPFKEVPVVAWNLLLNDWRDANLQRRALAGVGAARSATAVPNLLMLTRSRDKALRNQAITTLGMLGKSGKSGLPSLRRLAKSPDRATAAIAGSAIRRIEAALEGK